MKTIQLTNSVVALGKYQAVVNGGGIEGILAAARLAREGKQTALLESRGSLGWEITRARQTVLPNVEDIIDDPVLKELLAYLDVARTPDGQSWDPVACEVALDEYMEHLGIDVFFLVRPIKTMARETNVDIYLATKEGIAHLDAGTYLNVHLSQTNTQIGQTESYSFWNLTLLNASVPETIWAQIHVNRMNIPVRLRSSPHTKEVLVDVAYPHSRFTEASPELSFNRDLISLFPKLQQVHQGVAVAKLALVCDEPWVFPVSHVAEAGDVWQQHTAAWNRLFSLGALTAR
jgi:hypothetical protein